MKARCRTEVGEAPKGFPEGLCVQLQPITNLYNLKNAETSRVLSVLIGVQLESSLPPQDIVEPPK